MIYLHCDMNNYYAAVEILDNPLLADYPVVVCGDPSTRHTIVLSKNDLAKRSGIITGESIFTAMKKVNNLKVVKANYHRYVEIALVSRQIYQQYATEVIPYGIDEAWLILDQSIVDYQEAIKTANTIRKDIYETLGLTISVGVSYNFIFSKLASDLKKPNATICLTASDIKNISGRLPIETMLFVGPSIKKSLNKLGIFTIKELASSNSYYLEKQLGKVGKMLHEFANGDDHLFNPRPNSDTKFKSISNMITLTKDINDQMDILIVVYALVIVVSNRLIKHNLVSRQIGIVVKDSDFNKYNHQMTIDVATNNQVVIYQCLKQLLIKHQLLNKTIRSIGVKLGGIMVNKFQQLSFIEDNYLDNQEMMELDKLLKEKIPNLNLEKVATNSEEVLSLDQYLKKEG